jgi:hypothetical protein
MKSEASFFFFKKFQTFSRLKPHAYNPSTKLIKQEKTTTLVAGINPKETAMQNMKGIVN